MAKSHIDYFAWLAQKNTEN